MNISEIIAQLSQRLPDEYLSSKKMGGSTIAYIPWHSAVRILDQAAPGWGWEIRSVDTTATAIFICGRLTIPADDGVFHRDAMGTESLETSSYGDPSSNAESMAFRRCAAKFGLGLYLYDRGDRPQPVPQTQPQPQPRQGQGQTTSDLCCQWVDHAKRHGIDVRAIAEANSLPLIPAKYNADQLERLSRLISACIELRQRDQPIAG